MRTLLQGAMLRSASWLAPAGQRAEWLAEWQAELWHVRQSCGPRATRFCLGAYRDALWLRRNRDAKEESAPWLESPWRCLGLLAVAMGVCGLASLGPQQLDMRLQVRGGVGAMLYLVLMALPALPALVNPGLGDYPGKRRVWRWAFLAAKIGLLLPTVFWGVQDVASLAGWKFAPVHFILIGNVAALRWALADQRRRCPECLRLLAHPARIGLPSQTFLDWYGTEFACVKGHGLLHVPEIPTVSFRTQNWVHLDRSWSGLFL